MKPGVFLSVREKATRFPGKVLKPLGGKTVTAFVIDRLRTSTIADLVVLTTSIDPRDAVLCDIATTAGISYFRGSPDDKLLRYRDAARQFNLDFVVIADGDDPFISIEHIDRIIRFNIDKPTDYTICGSLPLGATGFGLQRQALENFCYDRAESNTEVWGGLFLNNPAYSSVTLDEPLEVYRRPDIRMTLDYPEDYDFLTTVVDGLAVAGQDTDFASIMQFLSARPEVIAINQGVQKKYEQHLEESATT